MSLRPGEIHALLGENGAGKSTLMNILFGALTADEGSILIDGVDVTQGWSAQKAIASGVGMIHQHFSLVGEHTVLENIVMPTLDWRTLRIDWQAHRKKLASVCADFGMSIAADAVVEDLTVGERQQVEILKMLYQGARVLILDEPTSVLTPQQAENLLQMLVGFKERGYAVVIITHKLDDAMRVCDHITVLRHGKGVATVRPCDVTVDEVAHMMVAQQIARAAPRPTLRGGASAVLRASEITVAAHTVGAASQVSLTVHAGEILGIAGVAGNGQSELTEALIGLRALRGGRIILGNTDVTDCTVSERRRRGLSFVPEDRHAMGMVANMDVAANMLLQRISDKEFSRWGVLNQRAINENACQAIREFDIRVHSPKTLMGTLSGGNQQKVVLSRELSSDPCALIISEPSRGLDFASTAYVRERLMMHAEAGLGVLLISSDLDELMALSHRIAVMYQGRIIGELDAQSYDIDKIGLMMAGIESCTSL